MKQLGPIVLENGLRALDPQSSEVSNFPPIGFRISSLPSFCCILTLVCLAPRSLPRNITI